MRPITTQKEPFVEQQKRIYGLIYGMVAGLAFAIALWGMDGYFLSRAHAYFPWTKLCAGSILTTLVGALAGWLVSRFEKTLLAILLWFATAGIFAWLTVSVPLEVAPNLMGMLEPKLRPLLHYTIYDNASSTIGVAFAWIMIAAFIVATIQIPMVEQSVFSTTFFGKISPYLICAILMAVSGSITDSFQNQPLRDPVIAVDKIIEFSLNASGKKVDAKTFRDLHLASLRDVLDILSPSRHLAVSRYDKLLQNVYVVVNFNGNWAECETTFGHPLMCKPISP